ncbi:GLPGLI family protein [Algibacter sp. L3A6]|uniref:GLPGLI family protein n=1 Tax=Algibacter sp. L3A6 TaxID=2686366 RepID=UPI00131CC806|nr:GLPGLI family protein [Algibacter sp. L3A6]
MKIIIFLTYSLILTSAQAQVNKKGLINYGHKQSMGMGAPIGVDYNSMLVFDNIQSTYFFAKDSLEGGSIRTSVIIKNEDRTIVVPKNTSKIGFIYNLNTSKDSLKSRDIGFKYVKEKIPKINWTISNKFKSIGGYKCQKAEGNFRGRNYTTWFAIEIPLPFGPWKLNGLPGLILEAYDTKKEVYFYFKSIKYPNYDIKNIIIPKPDIENKKWIPLAEYENFLISSYNRAIQNSRMVIEQAGIYSQEDKRKMKDSYIEDFEN